MKEKIIAFIKKETVFVIAILLGLISMCFVPISKDYLGYIDFHTLLLLFCLMATMAGFQKLGIFDLIASFLLSSIKTKRQLAFILMFLPFFFSMFITNDVALITFVPLTMIVLNMIDGNDLLIKLIALQTIAANLGSMLMPLGNPQNLYLYARSGMELDEFILLMLPYSLLSLVCLTVMCFTVPKEELSGLSLTKKKSETFSYLRFAFYITLFILCLLCVLKILSPLVVAVVVCIFLLIQDRDLFAKIDYTLLGTFVGFFVFIGNVSKIESFHAFLQGIIKGHEIPAAVLASQVISNVPAALLLSGFTRNVKALIIGTNVGGLGTLIASMASLISYTQLAKHYPEKRGKYLIYFTVCNLVMLIILCGFHIIWK